MNGLRIVCFGEILLRLSAPPGELPLQPPVLNACIAGDFIAAGEPEVGRKGLDVRL